MQPASHVQKEGRAKEGRLQTSGRAQAPGRVQAAGAWAWFPQPGRSFCARPNTLRYKGRAPRASLHHALRTPTPISRRSSTAASTRHGPQLLLCLRWILLLRRFLQMQTMPMHLLQEKLLLLLPRGLCEVLPGLHLQRGFGQVQLLRLKWGASPQLCK